MQLTRTTIRPWARQMGWDAREPQMLKTLVHDAAYSCADCGALFSDESDMAPRDETDRWLCIECFDECEPMMTEADKRREWGTW